MDGPTATRLIVDGDGTIIMATTHEPQSGRGTRTTYAVPAQSGGFHVSNLEIERIFFEARNDFIGGLDIDDVWHQPVVPQVREILTRFDAEVNGGAEIECATRVVSRSRRAFVMEQELVERQSSTVAATCRSVHVTVGNSGAVEIPDHLWAAIERRDGGPILNDVPSHG
jgi:acyl-CoA thioesterase FadM